MIVIPVPNAPCGVERYKYYHLKREKEKFLMHRVELKVYFLRQVNFYGTGFLMHRVELKVTIDVASAFSKIPIGS